MAVVPDALRAWLEGGRGLVDQPYEAMAPGWPVAMTKAGGGRKWGGCAAGLADPTPPRGQHRRSAESWVKALGQAGSGSAQR